MISQLYPVSEVVGLAIRLVYHSVQAMPGPVQARLSPMHYAKKDAFIFQLGLPAKASL